MSKNGPFEIRLTGLGLIQTKVDPLHLVAALRGIALICKNCTQPEKCLDGCVYGETKKTFTNLLEDCSNG